MSTPVQPRPVTPVGIAAALLSSVTERLRGSHPDEDLLADLARAADLVGGLDDYVAAHTSAPSADLRALEARTREAPWAGGLEQEMLSGHVEGAFLAMLVALTGARRVLEIGMFTGYSALAMAEALPADGRLVACEIDESAARIAREAFAASSAGDRIDVRVGDAGATLRDLAGAGERFDLVFVDADKSGYVGYLDALLVLDLLTDGAVVAFDNTLLQGEPWVRDPVTVNGLAIAGFNERLRADTRLEQVMVPLRDGITLVRRVDRA